VSTQPGLMQLIVTPDPAYSNAATEKQDTRAEVSAVCVRGVCGVRACGTLGESHDAVLGSHVRGLVLRSHQSCTPFHAPISN
jgi:hypothetical protein